jgi:methyl-accepting chemotaxis protein
MWNPLTLPLAALGAVAGVPRALAAVTRAADLLEQAVMQAEALNRNAEDARALLEEAITRVDALAERGDLVLEELSAAREVFAEAMLKVDRLSDQGERVLASIEATRPVAERLAEHAEPMVQAAVSARDQLRETQAELGRANEQITRALELAQPLENMTQRVEKLTSGLRRDSR